MKPATIAETIAGIKDNYAKAFEKVHAAYNGANPKEVTARMDEAEAHRKNAEALLSILHSMVEIERTRKTSPDLTRFEKRLESIFAKLGKIAEFDEKRVQSGPDALNRMRIILANTAALKSPDTGERNKAITKIQTMARGYISRTLKDAKT